MIFLLFVVEILVSFEYLSRRYSRGRGCQVDSAAVMSDYKCFIVCRLFSALFRKEDTPVGVFCDVAMIVILVGV